MGNVSRSTAELQFTGDTKPLLKELRKLKRSNTRAMREIKEQIQATHGPWKRFKDNIVAADAAMGIAGRGLRSMAAATRRLLWVLGDAIRMSGEQATGVRQMQFAFSNLGLDVDAASAQLERFAAETQRTTRYGDDATRALAAQFATMARGAVSSIDEVIAGVTLVQDIAEASGGSAEATVTAVARAYAGQRAALTRLLPAQAALLESNADMTEVVGALQEAFGGARTEIDETEQGIANLRNTWGDALEAMGDSLQTALVESGLLDEVVDWMEDLGAWLTDNSDDVTAFFADLGVVIGVAADGLEVFVGWVRALAVLTDTENTNRSIERFEERAAQIRANFERGWRWNAVLGSMSAQIMEAEETMAPRASLDPGPTQTELTDRRFAELARVREAMDAPRSTRTTRRRQSGGGGRSRDRGALGLAAGEAFGGAFGEPTERGELAELIGAGAGSLFDKRETGKIMSDQQTAFADAVDAMRDSWQSGLASMSTELGKFLGGAESSFDDFGQAIKGFLASTFSDIGGSFMGAAAQVIGGAASGPWGLFLALGGAFNLLSGMLSGGGGSSGGMDAARQVPDIMAAIRPDAGGPGGGTTVVQMSIGAVFGRDESVRTVASIVKEARARGEQI
jgi:hypothetical protein